MPPKGRLPLPPLLCALNSVLVIFRALDNRTSWTDVLNEVLSGNSITTLTSPLQQRRLRVGTSKKNKSEEKSHTNVEWGVVKLGDVGQHDEDDLSHDHKR